ncbi:solute carrier family 25 member 45-like isoform X1 [Ptychodera flava]|uniref:solute carrier family 25 member 45-like isoform X1 n=1 Tax=Ptychodera flava TaxID=63121 RepID=UPI00396A89DA
MVFLWADFIAGLVGGGAGVVVGHPLDTIKVRLQAQSLGAVQYKGIFDCIYKTLKHESVFGFYKGMGFPLATICIQNAVIFGVYGNTLHRLKAWRNDSKPATNTDIFISGCVAGFVQLSIACPVELVKIRLQMQTHGRGQTSGAFSNYMYKGPIHCLATVIKSEGFRGCFRGMVTTAARDMPSCGMYFLVYELLYRKLATDGEARPSIWASLLAGGTAGVIAWGLITPMDVVKSKMQADGVNCQKYRGVWHCVTDTYRTGGVRAFCTGLSINSLGDFPVSAVVFAMYTLTLHAFGEESRAAAK